MAVWVEWRGKRRVAGWRGGVTCSRCGEHTLCSWRRAFSGAGGAWRQPAWGRAWSGKLAALAAFFGVGCCLRAS
ncbi:hypothetical protein T484DRAFT_1949590 [Baffinella frigidus]|nr:hypothetical protein T484DRAFT_1949590 [Cryptophyta sp. CCMP2293]